MSATALLSRGELVALGWTLVHFCWQATAVASAYAVMNQLTSRATSATRYAVALIALTLMPVVALATFVEELRIATPHQTNGNLSLAVPEKFATAPSPILREISQPSPVEDIGAWLKWRAELVLPWVDAVWMLGVLLLATRAFGGLWHLEQVKQRARGLVPQDVAHSFNRICHQVRVGRRVALLVSEEVISPLAMGVWRATVILPASAVLGLPIEELEAVMAHELGHIRRWDYVVNLLQTAVEGVLFFHPAVWWLSRTVRERREVCCDEIAVRSCAGAEVYARALLKLEEQRTRELRLALALEGCSGSLLGRVRQVLGEGFAMECRMTSGVRVAAAGALMIALLLGPRVGEAVTSPKVVPVRAAAAVVTVSPEARRSKMVGVEAQVVASPAVAPVTVPAPRIHVILAGTESMPTPAVTPAPYPQVHVDPTISPRIAINAMPLVITGDLQDADGTASPKGMAYLDGMRAAGYPLDLNNDLDTLVALKSLGVTPEYAKSMSATGLGKPTVHELITLKSLGVTPEYVASLKQSGIGPVDLREVVTEKSLGVTPEYAAAMKQAGFGNLNVRELISLKAQGMTPEYAKWLKQQFPQATMDELRNAAVFHVDEKFIAEAKAHGFDGKNLDKLLRLKMSGLLDE
jgi:beta-lactamase regulating signal transducer with metallopeptidase domain